MSIRNYIKKNRKQNSIAYLTICSGATSLNTPQLAAGSFIPSYFSTLFKQNFGTSFSEYLSSVRMRKAMELLRDRSYKVKQIALLVGYKDPNYFIRSFKKKYGVTPDEFRKRGV